MMIHQNNLQLNMDRMKNSNLPATKKAMATRTAATRRIISEKLENMVARESCRERDFDNLKCLARIVETPLTLIRCTLYSAPARPPPRDSFELPRHLPFKIAMIGIDSLSSSTHDQSIARNICFTAALEEQLRSAPRVFQIIRNVYSS
jgi:hypothetical protein